MEEARITVTVKPIYLERILYWIIIIVLALLLVLSYMNSGDGDSKKQTEEVETPAATPPAEDPDPDPVPAAPAETCSDGVKNQDESDVDCGGTKCPGCPSGDACETAADCAGDYCVDDKCTNEEPVELSGDVELSITRVDTETVESTGAVKVTGLAYTINNGLSEDLGNVKLRVYLTSKRDNEYCLSQPEGEEFDCPQTYATWSVSGPRSGDKASKTIDLKDRYTSGSLVTNWGSTTFYDHGDDFNLYLYLYDDAGDKIDGKDIKTFKGVAP